MEEEKESTKHHKKSVNKHVFIVLPPTIIILAIIGFISWLYTGTLTDAKTKVFSAVPLPAAFIDNKPLAAKDLIARMEIAKRIPETESEDKALLNAQIYDQLVENKKLEAISADRKVSVSSDELDTEYKMLIDQIAGGDSTAFTQDLQKMYGISEQQFKDDVLRTTVLKNNLAVWYNHQESLNADLYKQARDLQSKLENGENFETIAATYTQDMASKDFAGDRGFVSVNNLLPEFSKALKDAQANDIKLVPSRYGLHIIKVLAKDANGEDGSERLHLQEIFVEQTNYQKWYDSESGKISVKKILKV